MKLFITACFAVFIFSCYSQCVIYVRGQQGNILIPFTENSLGINVPCDINSKKWKNYTEPQLLDSVKGEFYVYSSKGLEGKAKVISIDSTYNNGPYCGPIIKFSGRDYDTTELFALKTKWNIQPRPSFILNNENPVYKEAIKNILDQKTGLKNSAVVIKKIIKTDLDGDRKDEVIIQAANHPDIYNAGKGDYSIVIMQHIIKEKAVTDILTFQYKDDSCEVSEGTPCTITQYNISAILDLNGDGTMELLITDADHESDGVTAYELTQEGLKAVLDWGCGD